MVRIVEFFPSILFLVLVFLPYPGLIIFNKRVSKDSKAENKIYFENHKILIISWLLFANFISGPSIEELIFRMPLILVFSSLTLFSWLVILLSGCFFGFLHGFSESVLSKYYRLENTSPNSSYRLSRAIKSSIPGVILGYIGVKYQSLILCLIFHSLWNMIFGLAIPHLLMYLFPLKGNRD